MATVLARRNLGRMFLAKRFVAGTTISEAIEVVQSLNAEGMTCTLDFLGEDVTQRDEAERTREAYGEVIAALAKADAKTNLSLKITALGLHFDTDLAQRLVDEIIVDAQALQDPFVRIDMERSTDVPGTLEAFRRARSKAVNVGPVLQAYLRRTPDDVEEMIKLGARVRLCKGAYDECPEVAHTEKPTIRREYLRLAEALLSRGNYPGIATHDPGLIESIVQFTKERGIAPDSFEFQMLYGVRPSLQRQLVAQGFRLRIYLPFGTHWVGYFKRRIMERRANLFFAVGAMFSR